MPEKMGDHFIVGRSRIGDWTTITCACGEVESVNWATNFGSLLARHIQDYNKRVGNDTV